MERNVMGELNVYRGSGAKPNFSEIARRHGMDRHTVAKYWREGESAADGRSARGSAFDPLEEVIRAKAQLPGMTKMAVYAFLREGRGEGLPGYGAFTAWCRARDVPFGGAGGREPHPRFETPPGRQLQFDWKEGMRLVDSVCLATVFSTLWLPGSDNLAKEPPMSQISAFPSIKALSILLLVPLNSTSLPWWTTLSIIAEASLSSPRIVPHLLNSMLVVNTTLRFS